jgi:hypothetical protein
MPQNVPFRVSAIWKRGWCEQFSANRCERLLGHHGGPRLTLRGHPEPLDERFSTHRQWSGGECAVPLAVRLLVYMLTKGLGE